MSLGSAITPPLIAWLMVNVGWRSSFYVTAGFAFLIAILWRSYATDYPPQHTGMLEKELPIIFSPREPDISIANRGSLRKLLRNRNVCLLSLSYFFDGYVLFMFVFWFYSYLVDVRGFGILRGGIYGSLPFVASTMLTPLGGAVSDRLSLRLGRRWGPRIPAMVVFFLSGILFFCGAKAESAPMAIASLSLSVGFVQFTEGAFWSSAMNVAQSQAGTACGIMNMLGNVGGAVSTALVPVLVNRFGWLVALDTGSGLAMVGGLVWMGIQADRRLQV